MQAIRDNTAALRQNTAALLGILRDADRGSRREYRRAELLRGVPWTREGLLALKRQDLVMLAAALGVRETSVPQTALVEAVLKAQDEVPS